MSVGTSSRRNAGLAPLAKLPDLEEALRAYLEIRNAIYEALGKNHKPGPKP